MAQSTIHLAIGNSDDKLTQKEWSSYTKIILDTVKMCSWQIYGVWFSNPDSEYQNMAVSFVLQASVSVENFRGMLRAIREEYRQDSIAWNESITEMI